MMNELVLIFINYRVVKIIIIRDTTCLFSSQQALQAKEHSQMHRYFLLRTLPNDSPATNSLCYLLRWEHFWKPKFSFSMCIPYKTKLYELN